MILAQRVHLFPFRTQKLSSAEATILAWRRAGKIAHCQHHLIQLTSIRRLAVLVFIPRQGEPDWGSYSSLAQSVEHLTVNQGVVGSSPTGGAIFGGQFDNSSRKSLFYKDFFGFLGEILRKYFVTTPCEPLGLEPSTIFWYIAYRKRRKYLVWSVFD